MRSARYFADCLEQYYFISFQVFTLPLGKVCRLFSSTHLFASLKIDNIQQSSQMPKKSQKKHARKYRLKVTFGYNKNKINMAITINMVYLS